MARNDTAVWRAVVKRLSSPAKPVEVDDNASLAEKQLALEQERARRQRASANRIVRELPGWFGVGVEERNMPTAAAFTPRSTTAKARKIEQESLTGSGGRSGRSAEPSAWERIMASDTPKLRVS